MASRMKGSTVWDVSRERGCEGGRETVFSQLPPHCCGSCHFLYRETPKPPRAPCLALTSLFLQHCPSLSCRLISTPNQKGPSSTPVFITALFTIVKTWKQPKYPLTDELIKIYIHNGILLSYKKRRQRTRWLESITGHEFEQTLGDNEGQGSLVC